MPNVRKQTLLPLIAGHVERDSNIVTDELHSYRGLHRMGYAHWTVNHSRGEYTRGPAHVNSIEGFWSRLKVSIRGTHVHVSAKHLAKYVKEFEFRYNRRKHPEKMFAELVGRF